MKSKKIIIWTIIAVIILTAIITTIVFMKPKTELISVKSEKELMKIYEQDSYGGNLLLGLVTIPFSTMTSSRYYYVDDYINSGTMKDIVDGIVTDSIASSTQESSTSSSLGGSSEKDYSTTNIQVENVDEADITKTDGDYIYSISEDNVVITNVIDPANIKVEAKIKPTDEYIPEDLILYENKLIVIGTKYIQYNKYDTYVNVYDITNKSKPRIIQNYVFYEQYYTSRCIDGKLFVIASGKLRKEDDEIVAYYEENNEQKDIDLSNIKYIRGLKSKYQTLIASIDLNTNSQVKVNSYLFDVENAYISETNMYLLNDAYSDNNESFETYMKALFGSKGVIGFFEEVDDYDYDSYTNIYKFKICDNGDLEFVNDAKVKGTTINQFSLDEYEGNLRVGLYSTDGSRVVVFDEQLNQIGETSYLSKGERMYSTRFVGDKAYMVTYKNVDPLYVIDLSNPTNPEVLGKLKIPGYSTYLHPYDDNHLIGIGMQTEEKVYRNSSGKVTRTSTVITGMKMALFDVSDVNNPIQISETIIGDSRTTSAILTNHKALLFSAEKGIIAIPVNYYPSDFEIETSSTDISSMVNSYTSYKTEYISEGYFVYDMNLTDGFKLKGTITHKNASTKTSKYYYSNYYTSKLLRGMWIEDNLFTVSENMVKVNKLEDLQEITSLNIKEDK